MANALFINGIYQSVLTEILNAQTAQGGGYSYLQPYRGTAIAMLRENLPSHELPVRLYISTTKNQSQISYVGEIVQWEDKREISKRRRSEVLRHLEKYQSGEVNLFTGLEGVGKKAVNLITIRNLKSLDTLHSTAILRKISDHLPPKKPPRPGGFCVVHDEGDLTDFPIEIHEQFELSLDNTIRVSAEFSEAALSKRLESAPKIPEKVQVISVGFRRNPDVIVAVLRRAKGICERCKTQAPFRRQSDGSAYLEVHHWIPLSQGGEDTTDNAAALCPNCHREVHYGESEEK